MINNAFTIAGLLPSILITVVYFSKERLKSVENKLYSILLISNLTELILAILSYITIHSMDKIPLLNDFVSKSLIVSMLIWIYSFTLYVLSLSLIIDFSNRKIRKIMKYISIGFIFTTVLIIYSLPLYYYSDSLVAYSYGPSANVTFVVGFVCIVGWIISFFKSIKKITLKKALPIFAILLLGAIAIPIQKANPEMLLVSYLLSFITILMYFTIENPDLKIMNELENSRDLAEKANRAKSDFLSSMSHEIRTPLNAIVGLSEDNLKFKNKLPEDVVENSNDIINASQTLLEIVGNILDISKIESEKLELVENKYHFKDEIESMARVTSTRIGDKPINFNMHIAEDIPYELIGDKVHVKGIINNLLSNSFKYTEKGSVDFNVKCINNEGICNLIITVKDTGRGIKKENIDRLFHKFDRLDVEKNTTTEGTGLGLAITKNLVEMMGGKINVQSQYGLGSMFVVHLPQKISKMYKPVDEEILYNTTMLNLKAEENLSIYSNMRLLLVDDNKLNIKVAKKALADFNFIIDEAYDGQEALDKVKENKYDIILMDIMMPVMNGETAFLKMKQLTGFNTPVIALTADAVAGAQEKYLSIGFKDYLSKPFNREQIKQKLDNIFKSNENDKWKNVPMHVFGKED